MGTEKKGGKGGGSFFLRGDGGDWLRCPSLIRYRSTELGRAGTAGAFTKHLAGPGDVGWDDMDTGG